MNTINQASLPLNKSQGKAQIPGWLYIFPILLVTAVVAFNIFQPIKVLPRISLAPGFSFTNQMGQRLTSEDYRGKLVLYSFSYSHCGADCVEIANQMQALRERLNQENGLNDLAFALVTISVDPERETQATLREYINQFRPSQNNPITWDFVTGDPLRTKYVVGGGFGLYYKKETLPEGNEADYQINFEPRFVLVDGWGIIRAVYRTDTLDIERVIRDIGFIAREVRHSQGIARIAYEGAHLFQCYP